MDTKRIYFNIGHVVFVIIMLVFFFFVYVLNDVIRDDNSEVIIKSQKTTEMKYHKININDTNAFASIVKEVLKDRINIVSKPQILSQSNHKLSIQIDPYTVEVNLKDYQLEEKTEIKLHIYHNENTLIEKMTIPIEFVDTQAPTIVLHTDQIQIYEDEVFDANSYVETISDNYDDVNYQLVNDIPIINGLLKVGSYDLIYECFDSSKNRGETKLHVEVKERDEEIAVMNNVALNEQSLLHKQVLALVGKPYVWGGKGPDVFDCSGIIMYIYQLNGIDLAWRDIQYGNGTSISLDPSQWQVGDVLSYADHSGEIVHHALYLGNHMALHAITSGVDIIDIDTMLIGVDGLPQHLARVTRYNDLFIN